MNARGGVPQERKAHFRKFGGGERGAVDGRLGGDCTALGEVSEEGRAVRGWSHGAAVGSLGLSFGGKRAGYVVQIVDSVSKPRAFSLSC